MHHLHQPHRNKEGSLLFIYFTPFFVRTTPGVLASKPALDKARGRRSSYLFGVLVQDSGFG
jgi:hypothetical protein